jgi:hypothetical protein
MNTFRDPATNISVHVPTENDDPAYRGRQGEQAFLWAKSGGISTGGAGKYSPIGQERAKEAGKPVPTEVARMPVGSGAIHPRE